jgi:hypothetical protein
MSNDNYPDNIRQFDNDHRSPFYVGPPDCDCCGEEMEREGGYGEYGLESRDTCENKSCELNSKTSSELAKHLSTNLATLRQYNYVDGEYKGWYVIGKSGVNNENLWGKI